MSEKSQSLVSSTSASSSSSLSANNNQNNNNNGLTTMLQQVPNSNCMNIINLMSPSKPSNISELSNSSMLSSSSGSSTLDLCNTNSAGGTSKRSRNSKQSNNSTSSNNNTEMMLGKDGKYFERRKRNNVAAKKSRDARKQREDEIAIRASFLEKENSILKAQLQTLKDEAQQLRILLAQKKSSSLVQQQQQQQQQQSGCSNCSNCSAIAANCAKQNNNVIGIIGNGYGATSLNGGGGYDHSDLDKQHQAVLNSATSSNLANASIYLQHQTAHRHPII